MAIFIDLDGVLGGFDEHVEALFGAPPSAWDEADMWHLIGKHETFWTAMPLKEGAVDLWAAALSFNPTVLTGCPRTDFDRAAAHKREWVAGHFGAHIPVITCRSRDKQLHMSAPGDVLVDDRIQNVRRWEKAGGRGVLYRSPMQAIRDMLVAMAA